ncbi:MAG TPA: leucyl aminopeptidase [Streptosporangiaceae bacterium]|nr:leucyl aminopeptidase [Streptosporangiaceae bacterium]
MPVTCEVRVAGPGEPRSAGGYLLAGRQGHQEPAELAVVAVGEGGEVAADEALDSVLGASAADVAATSRLTGKAGQIASTVARHNGTLTRVLFLGVGNRSLAALRKSGGELGRLMRPGEAAIADVLAGLAADQVQAFTEGVLLGSYRFSEKSADVGVTPKKSVVRFVVPAGLAEPGAAVGTADTIAAAVALTRDLANTPSLRKTPEWLAQAAADVAARAGLAIRVRTEQELADAGFGGISAVGSGSARPPRLIELAYDPPGARRHVVLVGKGITFDSGGLSLKPNDGMKLMKTDMAGGAAVIAVMSALAKLGVSDRVTGLVAAAENMPSGSAFRPGDIITQFGGRTVEVLNTDAEGRLVLADAMAYAVAELAPDQIVDVATLTGAARIALGGTRAALYSTSDELATALLDAGERSGDRLWRMPLPDEYRKVLESPVADLSNVAVTDSGAGSVVAALFLREFSGGYPWAHLDIAGAARSLTDDGDVSAGATGFGTHVLLGWLASRPA